MSCYYSTKANEPIASILNTIHTGWISLYLKAHPDMGNDTPIPAVEHVGGKQGREISWQDLSKRTGDRISKVVNTPQPSRKGGADQAAPSKAPSQQDIIKVSMNVCIFVNNQNE